MTNGWWCKILPADIDNDGDLDFVVGNMGINMQYKCSETEPLVTYAADFDNNGKTDPIMTKFFISKSFPVHSRDELIEQMPALNKKFLRYSDYAKATLNDILTKEQIAAAQKFYVYHTASAVFMNDKGKFTMKELPIEAQFSCVNSISYQDYDGDGKSDLLLAGNFYPFRVQQGNSDAGIGLVVKGDGKGNFISLPYTLTGCYIPGDVRDMVTVKGKTGEVIVVAKNNAKVQVMQTLNIN
jgi:hypothetical protein